MKKFSIQRAVVTGLLAVAMISPALAQKVKSVQISPEKLDMVMGDVSFVTAEVSPSNAKDSEVWYTSSNLDVARVSSEGRIRAVGPGSATIKVISKSGYKKDTMKVNVTLPENKPALAPKELPKEIATTGVTITPALITVAVGSKEYATGKVVPANASDQGVWFESSDPSIATIDSFGVVRGVAPGEVTLKVLTAQGTITSTSKAKVIGKEFSVQSVKITPAVIRAAVGEKKYVTGAVVPSTALNKGVWFRSSDESVAKVNSFGVVTAVGEGIALITVHAADGGFTDTSRITVRAK